MNPLLRFAMILGALLLASVVALFVLGGKQYRFVETITVDAPPEVVYLFLTEPEHLQAWIPGASRAEYSANTADGDPASYRLIIDENGRTRQEDHLIMRQELDRSLLLIQDDWVSQRRWDLHLEPTDNGTLIQSSLLVNYKGIFRVIAPVRSMEMEKKHAERIRNLQESLRQRDPSIDAHVREQRRIMLAETESDDAVDELGDEPSQSNPTFPWQPR